MAALVCLIACVQQTNGEAMLQYFNTSWREITAKMPELAEAGYSSIWIPPPTKASGGLSVGYDLWDPFDLGGRDQRSTVATRYGTEAELLNMIETAHRFGIRVYADNIMNHRAFDIPGYNEGTPMDVYPGMVPEDFHLRRTEDGFYRKWDNCRDWNDAWHVMNLGLSDLIDIAHETPNANHGLTEGSTHPKPSFVRHPNNPEFYDRMPNLEVDPSLWDPWDWTGDTNKNLYIGFGEGNGLTEEIIAMYPGFFSEDVGAYLNRAVRWKMEKTKLDGLRLDAVKHVPDYFFGAFNDDASSAGYCGNAQWQFNMTRGFSDWNNHRDSNFNTEIPRDDALLFGEHLGSPPGYDGYWAAGMRLVDNDLRSQFNNRLGNMWEGLDGYDQPGYGGFAPNLGVMHAQSHDNDYAARRELQHAFYFLREGLGLLYTDGNFHAETLGESGGAFPRWANTSFLGQWGDNRVPNLLYCHEQMARGYQRGVWGDGDYVAWERLDWRQAGSTTADHVTMLVMLNDNYDSGQSRDIVGNVSFPHLAGGNYGEDAYLYNYSDYYQGFYTSASALNEVIVPPGGYFIFGYKNPDPAPMWTGFGGKPVTIYQNGQQVGTVRVDRKDGPDGDSSFNPYGLPDTNTTDFTYSIDIPRVTSATNLSFVARVDGSAGNVLMRLNGGIDLNGQNHELGDPRDNPPGLANDVFLGYENVDFVKRIWAEKFAAVDTSRSQVGSAGAETYVVNIGAGTLSTNFATGTNAWNNETVVSYVWHSPTAGQDGPREGNAQFWPPPTSNTADSTLYLGVKTPKIGGNRVHLYYTTNGIAWPEGAGGQPGNADTRVIEAVWVGDGSNTSDWWEIIVPPMSAGTEFRYKIGSARQQGYDSNSNLWDVVWPGSEWDITRKANMMGVWQVTNFNAETISYRPHNDYGETATGLPDGFHLITARAFLGRDDGAAVYNTLKQTFYLDAEPPQGYFVWPAEDNAELTGSEYGVNLRTDQTVREVWYRIEDEDPTNDDSETEAPNGNGNTYDAWQLATRITPEDMNRDYPQAWRFTYANLATGGTATIRVRLREWSSEPKTAWSNESMTAQQGHFNEITRTVLPRGDAYRLYFDFPQQDGDLVEAGWEIRVKYSSQYAAGLDDAGALALFSIRLNSAENGGDPANGDLLSHEDINISHNWDWPNENTITFTMPNVYNGSPDWLYGLEITAQRDGYPTLKATRKITTRGELLPSIIITDPPELGSDGRPHVIILPDVPAAELATNLSLRTTGIQLLTATNAVETGIFFTSPSGYTGTTAQLSYTNVGTTRYWNYAWSNLTAGTYRFTAWVKDADNKTNTASRGVTLRLLQVVDTSSTNDLDHDNDGMYDEWESTETPLPSGFPDTDPRYKPNPELWVNSEVHAYYTFGRSLDESPDSDGDGLPDGLELGFRLPSDNTDTNADTNGDGWLNFIGDQDPPFYNTLDNYGKVPSVDSQSAGGDRARLVQGTTTDPNNADSDYDGIPDGIEDANRNGWVDGDGAPIDPTYDPWLERSWPTGEWSPSWTETDPNNTDSDGDGLSDGYGEDKNFNGSIDGDTNADRIWATGEQWTETDPLNPDTDSDGLPDGWENQYGLDPLDSGVIDAVNMRTGDTIATTEHGADGDPDADSFSNLDELINGTNPRYYDDPGGAPPPAGTITIGRGRTLGVINGVTNYAEFTDWNLDDLIALDPYNTGGSQAVDIYRRWDGFDTSRDLVAFYMRDGGVDDNKLYFRVDLHDLQAHAEESALDVYVVIDFNSPSAGEAALPNEVDTRTDMKWEAVVGVYDSQLGSLYIDENPAVNTITAWDDLAACGVVSAPGGFLGAYFNAELDAIEFAIDRSALTGIGWNGIANNLNFQVFTVKDGTCNSCGEGGGPGPGDIGGRSDITDSIRNDWICSDYWRDQDYISKNGVLGQWIGRNADNDLNKSAKIAMLAHGNQAVQPGSYIQDIVNNGQGAGYHRPVVSHGIFEAPLNLHITPTLAIALEWAEVKDGGATYRSGPALNAQIRSLVTNHVISLMASTYSDHILPYFHNDFNQQNIALASEILNRIYSSNVSTNSVFWTPERVVDGDVLAKLLDLGFKYTLVDQNTHVYNWYGRQVALSDDGYRINRINGVDCFVINNAADGYRFVNHDSGIALPMRELFSRRARSDRQDQVSTIFCMWEDFNNLDQANAYDNNLRWLANRPWIQLVALEDIASGDVSLPWGQSWEPIDRGDTAGSKLSFNWINHANNENYDNWYVGSDRHEGLQDKHFEIRPGVTNPTSYGMLYSGGLISNTWDVVQAITHPDVQQLAAEVLHASVFETAFHDESNHALDRWSFGEYIYPASDWQDLASFAKIAHSQSRMAAIYSQVDAWANAAAGLTQTITLTTDSDLDGESEYWLYNRYIAAVFERIGGRMIAAWLRSDDGSVRQMIGNLVSYAGAENEQEGAWNINTDGETVSVEAYRTSALKDWWVTAGEGSSAYVNNLYTATTNGVQNGWKFTSSDGKIAKTITLAPDTNIFTVGYTIDPTLGTLYVRNGLSPDLSRLLYEGQRNLAENISATAAELAVTGSTTRCSVSLNVTAGEINVDANDNDGSFDSIPMRNQAQTRQIEVSSAETMTFTLQLENTGAASEWENWCDQYSIAHADFDQDADSDGATNWQEYIAGTDPRNASDVFRAGSDTMLSSGFSIGFDTVGGRSYTIWYSPTLTPPAWSNLTPAGITGDGSYTNWTDTSATQNTSRYYRIKVEAP
jgi:hypothetical protein